MRNKKRTIILTIAITGLLGLVFLVTFIIASGKLSAHNEINASLIEELASKNPPIIDYIEKLPEGWSAAENDRVHAVYDRIKDNCRKLTAALIARAGDRRFCTYNSISAPYEPQSVGSTCRELLSSYYDPVGPVYKFRTVDDMGQSGGDFFSGKSINELEEWWRVSKFKTDEEIGYELKSWHIKRENSLGYKDEAEKKWILGSIEERYQRFIKKGRRK